MQTQWRAGFAGAIGLDYTALFHVAKAMKIRIDAEVLRKIRALESMVLMEWAEERKRRERKS